MTEKLTIALCGLIVGVASATLYFSTHPKESQLQRICREISTPHNAKFPGMDYNAYQQCLRVGLLRGGRFYLRSQVFK